MGDPFGECGVGGLPLALEGTCVFFGSPFVFFKYCFKVICVMGIPSGLVGAICLICRHACVFVCVWGEGSCYWIGCGLSGSWSIVCGWWEKDGCSKKHVFYHSRFGVMLLLEFLKV